MGNRSSDVEMGKGFNVVRNSDEAQDCDFDNGLVLSSYRLPEEIITEILNNLPPKDILNCRLVCKRWNETLYYLMRSIYNKTFNTRNSSDTLPFNVYYITVHAKKWYKNLLKNVNGEEKFKHWKISTNGGDGWSVEDVPQGCEPLPRTIEEFNEYTSCFVTSYGPATKRQYIHVKDDRHLSFIINKFKPTIYVSEWVTGRFDCGATYELHVTIGGKGNDILEKSVNHEVQQWEGVQWHKKEVVIEDYPDDVEFIVFEHSGRDTQFWKGHYGMKMAGGVVKLLTDKFV